MRAIRGTGVGLLPLAVFAAWGAACAARGPGPTPLPPAAPSAAGVALDPVHFLNQGCYACLQQALSAARQQRLDAVAFEAAVLLAVRARELGMPDEAWLAEARRIAGADADRLAVLEVAGALPHDPLAGDRDASITRRSQLRASTTLAEWSGQVQRSATSPAFKAYMELALTCASAGFSKMTPEQVSAVVPASLREVPLLQYRFGICAHTYRPALQALRVAEPDFVDADYPLARYAMQGPGYPDPDAAIALLRSAAAAFPDSAAIATTAGNVHQAIEAWPEALAAYEAALSLVRDHPDAMLGRTISLSHLGRHDEAVAAATRLVDRATWFVGQALYWRAWNHFELASYVQARADADRAGELLINAGVFLLSGMIDWRLGRLDTAETNFAEALRMDAEQCEAATFLGGVRSERARPADALAALRLALQCYDSRIAERRAAIGNLEASAATAAHKAREIARHRRAIDESVGRRAEALEGIGRLERYFTSNPRR